MKERNDVISRRILVLLGGCRSPRRARAACKCRLHTRNRHCLANQSGLADWGLHSISCNSVSHRCSAGGGGGSQHPPEALPLHNVNGASCPLGDTAWYNVGLVQPAAGKPRNWVLCSPPLECLVHLVWVCAQLHGRKKKKATARSHSSAVKHDGALIPSFDLCWGGEKSNSGSRGAAGRVNLDVFPAFLSYDAL